MTIPSRNQIAAQVDAVLGRDDDAACIAIRSPARGDWPQALTVRGRPFRLRWCDSPLAVRQSLTEAEADAREGVVLLTDLGDVQLGTDVIARLARARVFQVDNWDMVRQMFQAREVDSRLARQRWIANALIENTPPEGYPPAPGGFLDLETAWKHALEGSLELPDARPDAVALLRWSMTAQSGERFARLDADAQRYVAERLGACAGPVGTLIVACIAAGNALEALPIGLVCGIVFAPENEGQVELAAAAARLERLTADRRIGIQEGRRWADAAAWVVRAARSENPDVVRPFIDRADGILRELHIANHVRSSDVLPCGFEARLVLLATALSTLIADPGDATLAAVEQVGKWVLRHDIGATESARTERVRMARRLARWLARGHAGAGALQELARGYATDSAFVDWARLKLLGGDELAAVSTVYAALVDAVRSRREALNRRFAVALKAWNAEGSVGDVCVPVEAILDKVIGPLAHKAPLLLLVVDGLSYPIFHELSADLLRHGWRECIPAGASEPLIGVAALPTVTEVSRASLLAGQLTCGASNQEKAMFAANLALLAASRSGHRPTVFHKGELTDEQGLAQGVRDAVGQRDRRVVAVVYNAVDDHLGGSDQLHQRWSLDDMRLLLPLLHESRAAGRTVVITADHGHVIEEQTIQRTGTDGDRWRTYDARIQSDEILLQGGRVRTPTGATQVVCAWSECVRYSSKRNGYHGGASPQEVLVPLAVFLPVGGEVEGWRPAPPMQPEWWDERPIASGTLPVPAPAKPATSRPKAEGQGELFAAPQVAPASDWIAALFASATYQQQRQLAARVAPQDGELRRLLEALDSRGGKLSKTALAQKLDIPLMRVSGFVNAARRVLNVDQTAVLALDEAAGAVEFNRELLSLQFNLNLP